MLYVLRLAQGDCVIVYTRDEQSARELASRLAGEDGGTIVSARELSDFAVRLSPNDEASLGIHSWNDSALDNILAQEYPALNDAFRAANRTPILTKADAGRPLMPQLKQAYEENTAIIRKGLQAERERFGSESAVRATVKSKKAVRGRG